MRQSVLLCISFIFVLLSSCTDTVGSGNDCPANEKENPITGTCEPIVRDRNNKPQPNNNANNGGQSTNTTANNGTTGTTTGSTISESCQDCPVQINPGRIVFSYTPVLESKNNNITLKSNVDSIIKVTAVEFENATPDEFSIVGINVGDTISGLGVVSGNVQFTPKDQTDDDVILKISFEGISEPATLILKSRIMGTDLCSENCPRIQVSPSHVALSFQPMSPNIEQTIVVGSVGQANIVIHEILLVQQGAAFSLSHDQLPMTLRPSETRNLDLTFDTSSGGGPTGEILIRSNDPFTPEIKIPLSATTKGGSEDPCIDVTPVTLNFGSLQRGQTQVRNFAITNCGIGPLNVTGIERGRFFGIPTSSAYQLTGWTGGIVPANQTQLVEMTYSPGRAGRDNGSFNVRSDATASPSVRVSVRAISETPPIADQDIHIKVEWNSDDTDVDTHVLLLPGNQAPGVQGLWCDNDCYFQHPERDWGVPGDWQDDPFLDLDDVDGFGPENVNIAKGINGKKYRVVLHYYDDSHEESGSSSSDVTVSLYHRGMLQQTWGPLHLERTSDTRDVFEIAWPSRTITTLSGGIYRASRSCSP